MPGSAAVEIKFFSSQNTSYQRKTRWDPPVLWNFPSRIIFLHHIKPNLGLNSSLQSKALKIYLQKRKNLSFFDLKVTQNSNKYLYVVFLPIIIEKKTKMIFFCLKNSFPCALGK